MAPSYSESLPLAKRYICNGNYYSYPCRSYSRWNDWGRWVALVVIVVVILLIAFAFSCFNTRRRRRRGMSPMYGTGWMAGKTPTGQQQSGYYNSNQPYNGGQAYNANPAPPYSPPIQNQQTGNTFNSNEGYYGQQNNGYGGYGGGQNGIELQPPQNVYAPPPTRGANGEALYEAPQGPPPGKGDGIIR